MRKLTILAILLCFLAVPVSAEEFTAPEAPQSAQEYMPEDTESFGEGVWYIFKTAIGKLQPSVVQALGICLSLIAVTILVSLFQGFDGMSKRVTQFAGVIMISMLLIQPMNVLVKLGTETVTQLSEYGKLLLPVMTAAMAAQGGVTASASMYTATAFFSSLLSAGVSKLIVPMIYIYLCLSVANSAIGEELLNNLRNFVKWLIVWSLKTVLYIFTGYIAVTGVVSGTADAAAVRAAKITLSSAIPVVGGIISEASEAILVGAGVMKSAAGVYGLLAILAVCVGPFLQVGVQYLMLKLTASVCGVIGAKETSGLIADFSATMGLILAMTGTVCLLLLISTVCFMKGAV